MELVCSSCGQKNPPGTALCGGCGKPLSDEENQTILNMRYEGAARRSQTYNTTIVDRIWNFFSSVKVGIWIIVLLLLASSVGTILPQEMYIPPTVVPAEYYYDEYGWFGRIFYELGFHNLYRSWWYILLLAALTISLIIASVDRFFPLYRSLKNQRTRKHINFLKKQRLYSESQTSDPHIQEKLVKHLKSKKYNVTVEGDAVLAEKGRFSRWGPYVNHVGLIIFLIGGMLRFFPGMYVDEYLWIREGQTEIIPGTEGEYYLENHQFLVELYDENDEVFQEAIQNAGGPVVKTYETTATLYRTDEETPVGAQKELQEVDSYKIRVNEPFKFDDFALYQVDYKLNELSKMMFQLENKETGEKFGEFTVDLYNPERLYELDKGYSVTLRDYFPDYILTEDGLPGTKSKIPNNPAFIFEMKIPNQEETEVSFLAIGRNLEPLGENSLEITLTDVEMNNVSALTVRKDHTLPFLFIGGFIFMIGLTQGSYWTHRRVWIQKKDRTVILAAHTNKNWIGLKHELDRWTEGAGLERTVDRTEGN